MRAVPTLHSWRAADFLYDDIISRWGKPQYVRTDNVKEFQKSFSRLCRALAIHHATISVGNSKGNGQAERTIRVIKEVIRRAMTKDPETYWSNHLPPAGMLLRFTAHRATRLPAFRLATGRVPIIPSAIPLIPDPLPNDPSPAEELHYAEQLSQKVEQLG